MKNAQSTSATGLQLPATPPLLITGKNGTLGRAFQTLCQLRGLEVICLSRAELDITDSDSITHALRLYQPWALVNTAGYVRVDDAETDAARCYRENATGPALLAQACAAHGIPFLTFSSDLVFDGGQARAYLENDPAHPLNVYGHSKLLAEQAVLARYPQALVVRTSAFFSAWDSHNFVHHALAAARVGQPFATYVPDLVNTALDLLLDEERGIWHLTNQGTYTWAELARLAVGTAGLDAACVVPRPVATFGWAATRPPYSALSSQQGLLLPTVESGLHRYLADEQRLQTSELPVSLVA
jgi:dTDP-4-dehydrorhamnose reductase